MKTIIKIEIGLLVLVCLIVGFFVREYFSPEKEVAIDTIKKIVKKEEIIDIKDVVVKLEELAKEGEQIFVSSGLDYSMNSFLKNSALFKEQFIFEEKNRRENSLLNFSGKDIDWIVLQAPLENNFVYRELNTQRDNLFLTYYTLEFHGNEADIYKLKDKQVLPIIAYGNKLLWRYDEFVVRGINSYNLAYKSRLEIEKTFKSLSAVGVNTIRFWAFKDGDKDGIQVKLGVMNEKKLNNLDFVMAMANKYQIHVIPVLVNNWNDYGGRKQYVSWSKSGGSKDSFYSSSKIREMFKNYISHIVPRENSITGVSYPNDLAILSWELMNEPRSLARNGEFVRDWTREMSEYIKEKDKMHLVYIGSEAEVGKNFTGTALELCTIDSIDICSSHIYLYDGQKSLYRNLEQVAFFVNEQGEFAKEQEKPLLVGEFGISEKHQPFKETPLKVMDEIIKIILKNDSAGFLIWDWDPLYYYDAFSFGMDENKKYNIKKLESLINIK